MSSGTALEPAELTAALESIKRAASQQRKAIDALSARVSVMELAVCRQAFGGVRGGGGDVKKAGET